MIIITSNLHDHMVDMIMKVVIVMIVILGIMFMIILIMLILRMILVIIYGGKGVNYDDNDEYDDLYIIGAVCLSVCL